MWDQVVSHYNDKYAEPNQRTTYNKDGLCTQYYKMYKTAKPMGDPTCPEYIQHAKKLKCKIEDEVAMIGIDDEDSELAASDIEADEEPEPEANNTDDIKDSTESNTIEDNAESNTTQNDNDDNIQADGNDDEYNGTNRIVTIAIKSDITSSTVIWVPPSTASQARKLCQKPSRAKEDNVILAILKSFNPEV
jgi:predicted MPP superfamily phosphohydrolase